MWELSVLSSQLFHKPETVQTFKFHLINYRRYSHAHSSPQAVSRPEHLLLWSRAPLPCPVSQVTCPGHALHLDLTGLPAASRKPKGPEPDLPTWLPRHRPPTPLPLLMGPTWAPDQVRRATHTQLSFQSLWELGAARMSPRCAGEGVQWRGGQGKLAKAVLFGCGGGRRPQPRLMPGWGGGRLPHPVPPPAPPHP